MGPFETMDSWLTAFTKSPFGVNHGSYSSSLTEFGKATAAFILSNAPHERMWVFVLFFVLGLLYAAIAGFALYQLIHIELRVPEYGWTTQKIFHLLNFAVNAVRAGVFFARLEVYSIRAKVITLILLDLPGILFFTTYTLLVRFWAEIYYQALRSGPTNMLRPAFLIINAAVYVVQVGIWVEMAILEQKGDLRYYDVMYFGSKVFFAAVSLLAAAGFLLYGGRLYLMLRKFPIESKGRRKKLREVGFVTAICSFCFTLRAVMVWYSAFNEAADVDVFNHPVLSFVYYLCVEIVPSALVLFILRKLPPRRMAGQYHPIR